MHQSERKEKGMYLLPSAGKTWQSQVTISFVLAHDWSKTCLLWLVIAVQNKFLQTYLSQIDHGNIFLFFLQMNQKDQNLQMLR